MATKTEDKSHLPLLAKMLTTEQALELLNLVRNAEPTVDEIPLEKLQTALSSQLGKDTKPSPDDLAKVDKTDTPDPPTRVVIVGATPFYLLLSEMAIPGSVFCDSKRRVFPERDPALFAALVSLLRSQFSVMESWTDDFRAKVREEAKFYGFFDLIYKPLGGVKAVNLGLMKHDVSSSSSGGGDKRKILTRTTSSHPWENAYSGDSKAPYLEFSFTEKVVVGSASIIMTDVSRVGRKYNVFDAVLLADNGAFLLYEGSTPETASGTKWTLIGRVSSDDIQKGPDDLLTVKAKMKDTAVLTNRVRIQFRRKETNDEVLLTVRNVTLNGIGASFL